MIQTALKLSLFGKCLLPQCERLCGGPEEAGQGTVVLQNSCKFIIEIYLWKGLALVNFIIFIIFSNDSVCWEINSLSKKFTLMKKLDNPFCTVKLNQMGYMI